jgi:hypothetical protein
VKKRILSLSFLATLAIALGMICWGGTLHAQSTPPTAPQTQQPDTTPPPQPPDTKPAEPESKQASPSANSDNSQIFLGTVVKQGDKYVLKGDSGRIYDIDHQTDVAEFAGKRVRVRGRLDPSGKKILVQ